MPIFSFIWHIVTELFGKTDNCGQKKRVRLFINQTMCLQNNLLRRKKILGRNNEDVPL